LCRPADLLAPFRRKTFYLQGMLPAMSWLPAGGNTSCGCGRKDSRRVAADYVKGDAKLQSYQSRIREEIGRELGRSVQIRRMVDVAMHSDRLMDTLFGALSPDQMKSVMRAQIPPAWDILRELTGDGRIKKA